MKIASNHCADALHILHGIIETRVLSLTHELIQKMHPSPVPRLEPNRLHPGGKHIAMGAQSEGSKQAWLAAWN
jgi:hypothetical protein